MPFPVSPYFKASEFDSPDKPLSGLLMDTNFIELLIKARAMANVPFIIDSGFRTTFHNLDIKGKIDSSHLLGLAADIRCTSSRNRLLMISSLLSVGFNRIGIGDNFIHVDCDVQKDKDVIWIY